MKFTQWALALALTAALVLVIGLLWPQRPAVAPTTNTSTGNQNTSPTGTSGQTTVFSTADLPDRDPHFAFILNMPVSWTAEYVPASQAINFFDATVAGDGTTMGNSQVFVQYYQADDFQPDTYSQNARAATVGGRSAKWFQYQVPKNVQFSLAPGYPAWVVTKTHRLVHIRTGSQAPYIFYIFHQSPELGNSIFNTLLDSLLIGG